MQQQVFSEVLKLVPLEGWSFDILERASANLGLSSAMGRLFFPYGNVALIELWINNLDKQMMLEYAKVDTSNMKIHERILLCLKVRFKVMNECKAVIHKTLSFLALPWNIGFASRLIWGTVDLIWCEAGNDQSVDFHYYTKRSLLSGVYSSSILYWISDDSENNEDTERFIERRLNDVLHIGKITRKLCK